MDSKLPFLLQESFSCFSLLGLEVIHELHKGYSEWENENRPKPKSRNVCKLLLTVLTLPVSPLVLCPIPFPVGCLQGLGHQLQLPARAPSPHPSARPAGFSWRPWPHLNSELCWIPSFHVLLDFLLAAHSSTVNSPSAILSNIREMHRDDLLTQRDSLQ